MSPERKRFKVWKVNLVEQPGWAPWESGGKLADMAFEETLNFMQSMRTEGDYYSLVTDLAGPLFKHKAESGPHEWTPRPQLTSADVKLLSRGLLRADPELELSRQIISDAATWMYEAALTPSDRDARDALVDAKREIADNWELGEMPDPWELGYDNLWAPLLETGLTLTGILSGMVGDGINYHRQEGYYDRFLEFNLNRTDAPFMLLEKIPKKDRGWVTRSIEDDWKRLSKALIETFFDALTKEMRNVDPYNRTVWRKSWADALKAADLASIQKEMLDFIREARKQEGRPS